MYTFRVMKYSAENFHYYSATWTDWNGANNMVIFPNGVFTGDAADTLHSNLIGKQLNFNKANLTLIKIKKHQMRMMQQWNYLLDKMKH